MVGEVCMGECDKKEEVHVYVKSMSVIILLPLNQPNYDSVTAQIA